MDDAHVRCYYPDSVISLLHGALNQDVSLGIASYTLCGIAPVVAKSPLRISSQRTAGNVALLAATEQAFLITSEKPTY